MLDEIIEAIKKDDYFSDIRIIKAYPCSAAPARLAEETVAIGFEEVNFSSVSVDESARAGETSVFIDIFIPIKMSNAKAIDIFSRLCRCFHNLNILSVRAERITVDIHTASYLLKTAFTFHNEIEVI